MTKKATTTLALPSKNEIPDLIDEFPYSLDQTLIFTNKGCKSTVYRYVRAGIWPAPIKIGRKPAYLGKTIKAICRGEYAAAA